MRLFPCTGSAATLNYAPVVNHGRIRVILSKPRACYLIDSGALGLPVFDLQGKVIGIVGPIHQVD